MITSAPGPASTIFVSIAAYRDSETPHTVADLFAKADHPERITVGVLNQLDLPTDLAYIIPHNRQVRQQIIAHSESKGACWARATVFQDLLEDEEFVLQIDSHMRFDKGWDTRMLDQWAATQDPMAMLTNYPMPYDSKTNVCREQMYVQFQCKEFDPWGLPKVTSAAISLMDAPEAPKYTVFLAAGCFFGKAHAVRTVKYDPHIYFNGEEINYAVRLWTHGYNLYMPNHPFLYHDYGVDRGRKLHWSDNPEWTGVHAKAMERLRFLFQVDTQVSEDALENIADYGLGTVRTLTEWQMRHGIHFRNKLIAKNATSGDFQ